MPLLTGRSFLKKGAEFDLLITGGLVFDGSGAGPAVYPDGIPFVIVNGQTVIDGGEHTGSLPGRVLRIGQGGYVS